MSIKELLLNHKKFNILGPNYRLIHKRLCTRYMVNEIIIPYFQYFYYILIIYIII